MRFRKRGRKSAKAPPADQGLTFESSDDMVLPLNEELERQEREDLELAAELGLLPSWFLDPAPDEPLAPLTMSNTDTMLSDRELRAVPETGWRRFLGLILIVLGLLGLTALLVAIWGLVRVEQQSQQLSDEHITLAITQEELTPMHDVTPDTPVPPMPSPTWTPSPETTPVLASLEVTVDESELPADGQAVTGITITLLDDSGQVFLEPPQLSLQIETGSGVLFSDESEGRQVFPRVEEGRAWVSFRAGDQAGPVSIVARSDVIEQHVAVSLVDIIPARVAVELSPPILRADGMDPSTLTVRVYTVDGELVPGETALSISADPPGLVVLDNPTPLAVNGQTEVTVLAGTSISQTTDVKLTATAANGVTGQTVLKLKPVMPPPPQCRTLPGRNTKLYRDKAGLMANALLEPLPADLIVECTPRESWSDIGVPITVTGWVSATNLQDGTLANVVEASLWVNVSGVEVTSGQDVAFYVHGGSYAAEGYSVEIVEQQQEWFQIRIKGFIVLDALETVPEEGN